MVAPRTRLTIFLVLVTNCALLAQGIKTNEHAIGIPLGKPAAGFTALENVGTAQCSAAPAASDATSVIDSYYSLDSDLAGKVGIHFIGSANASAEAHDVVLVREFRKYASCDANDGSGVVQYGHALRATVLIAATDLSGDLNFAVVAASSTLKNRSARVLIENTGFTDSQVNTSAQEAMSAVASSGLTVVTFSKFSEKLEAAFSAVQNSKMATPLQKIAFVPKSDPTTTLRSIATTFGLQCLSEARPCAEAMARFPNRGSESDAAIRDIYTTVTNSCATVTDIQKLQAQTMLGGIRVQPKCH